MRRVVRPGGTVAACMWESGENMQLLDVIWRAASVLDPSRPAGDPLQRYRTREEIFALWQEQATSAVEMSSLQVIAAYSGFDDFWQSVIHSAGSVADYIATLNEAQRERLRDECQHGLGNPSASFEFSARAWAARTRV
jgi:hypothetical protein